MIQAIILAGGKGTRLRPVSGDLPKPLVEANGRPLLDYQLEHIASSGIRNVIILAGYGAHKIEKYCAVGSRWGLNLTVVSEEKELGTAGAVLSASEHLNKQFMIFYGDTVFDIDIRRMTEFHDKHRPDATLFIHPNDHPQDSDLVEIDDDGRVLCFHPYPHPPGTNYPNLVNAAVYILEKSSLENIVDLPDKPDFGKHVFPLMLSLQMKLMGYRSPEYIKDAGTPERLKKVSKDLLSGRVKGLSLANECPAVFIDRDGTLIEECGHLSDPKEVKLIAGAAESLAKLNNSFYRTVCITNQPVVARGECDEHTLQLVHNRLETLLGEKRAYLDRIYFCPHHPDSGFAGERRDLKIVCKCRKPSIGLIERAKKELNIDCLNSWFIGDTTTDVLTAKNTGIRSILVGTGSAGRDGKWPCLPDFECPSFEKAVDLILNRWVHLKNTCRDLLRNIESGSLILIGGQARSGKSTWAATLAYELRKDEVPCVVIPLDCFLFSENVRPAGDVISRYDLDAVIRFVLEARQNPGKKTMPRYDRVKRTSIKDGVELDIPLGAVIVIEGVPALTFEKLRNMASFKLFVEREEIDRINEVKKNYRWRDWDDARIDALLEERAIDEVPLIQESKSYADAVLKEPSYG